MNVMPQGSPDSAFNESTPRWSPGGTSPTTPCRAATPNRRFLCENHPDSADCRHATGGTAAQLTTLVLIGDVSADLVGLMPRRLRLADDFALFVDTMFPAPDRAHVGH